MNITVQTVSGETYNCQVDDLIDIETAFGRVFSPLPSELVTAINTQYGTLQSRTQNKIDFQGWMDDVNTAIGNTENDLPAPTLANLATITAIVNELNAIRRRQNRIMKAIRYIARLLFRQNLAQLR